MDTSYFAYDRKKVPAVPKIEQPFIVINITSTAFCPRLKEQMSPYLAQGYEVYYVPVSPADAAHIKAIEASLQHTVALKVLQRDPFSQFVQILQQSEKVICSRLHLFLVASFLGVPTEIVISPMKVATHQHKLFKMKEVIEQVL
jgi:exopolysaccharide biosynthesis predicted pyruvyltransferase EpsI